MALWRSILNRIGLRAQEAPAPDDDFWYGPAMGPTASGARVTPDTALQLTAVFACVRVLSETIASLPLFIYRWRSDGGKERAPYNPLYEVLHSRPNQWQTSFEFREMMQGHLELRGNAYARIVSGPRGAVDQLIPLHPDRVTPRRILGTQRILYKVNWEGGTTSELTQEEMFHLRGFSLDGVTGLSPVALEREAIGVGLSAQEYAGRFFANDATPSGLLKHPAHFDSEEAEKRFLKSWQAAHSGSNRHKTAMLEDGITYEAIGLTNRDSQFLESRKYQAEDIARIFRVPPHKIGILDRATNNNIEHQGIEFVTDSIVPRARRWEQRINADLILAPETYFAEFLVDGLLRGDIASRYAAYATARQNGWLNANEIRKLENMNPYEGGDTYWAPVNMVPAEQLGKVPPSTPPPAAKATTAQVEMIVEAAAERVIRKEVGGLRKIVERADGNQEAAKAEIEKFYAEHARFVASVLGIPQERAESYCRGNAACFLTALEKDLDFGEMLAWLESKGSGELVSRIRELSPC